MSFFLKIQDLDFSYAPPAPPCHPHVFFFKVFGKRVSLVLKSRSRLGATLLHHLTHFRHVLHHDISGNMFGEDVGRVVGTGNLAELKVTFLDPILYPEIGDM